jgi:hypothetical protein
MSKRLDLYIRTGKHEPPSYACDRGHKTYKHQDEDANTKMNK